MCSNGCRLSPTAGLGKYGRIAGSRQAAPERYGKTGSPVAYDESGSAEGAMNMVVNRFVFESLYVDQEMPSCSSTESSMKMLLWSVDGKSYLPLSISTVRRQTVSTT